jgi:YbbR domain-containing protein
MRKLFFENIGLKISAVMISVVLWFFVTSRGQSEISLEVPLEFKSIPAELGIMSTSAKTVTVTVRGQERAVKNLKPADIRVSVDLGKGKKGEEEYQITKDDIKLPYYAMSVTNVSPSSVKVIFDQMVSRTVPVQPSLTGTPEKGIIINAISVEPETVMIRGPQSEIRKIDILKTEVMNISGLRDTVTKELEIITTGLDIHPEVNTVRVTITAAEKGR